MANILRFKRRETGAAGSPSSLFQSEPAYNEVDDTLYLGVGSGGAGGTSSSIRAVGGSGYYVNKTGTQTISGDKTFTGSFDLSGATVAGFTIAQNLIISGNLTVNGTTTTVNSTTMSVDDKNLELGATSSPTDAGANGGGITLKATTDKTFNWIDATDSWTSSESIDLASGKTFRIENAGVLSKTGLGSTVVASSLTSVGTLTSGVWAATDVAIAHGGTGASTATDALTNLGFSAYGKTLIDDANAATARTTLGLGSIATQNFNAVNIDGGTIDGITFDMGTF